MFSGQPSLPSSIMLDVEMPTATEEFSSAEPASPPPSISGNALFSDVSENPDDVTSLGELVCNY